MARSFRTLDDLSASGKTVLVRMDLNVPMQGGKVADATRIARQLPTVRELAKQGARIVLLSHFDRPEGKFVPSMSLAPLVDTLSAALPGAEVKFGVDCIGAAARDALGRLTPGNVLLLENLRFHAEEEANDANFARDLAALGDAYVNDAFSCSHRAHASITGIPSLLPAFAGRLMEQELTVLSQIFASPRRPIGAIVGGSKISTKLALLENLVTRMDLLCIGGAMAHTFLLAQGYGIGQSVCERNLKAKALKIMRTAEKAGCELLLPVDLVVTGALAAHAACRVVGMEKIPERMRAVDVGPQTVHLFAERAAACKTLVWNGPLGAFETSPFDAGTIMLARSVAGWTQQGKCRSIAGGGDTVAALTRAGLQDAFSYLSTAGGAFLEWLEGKTLPGVAALMQEKPKRQPSRPLKKARA